MDIHLILSCNFWSYVLLVNKFFQSIANKNWIIPYTCTLRLSRIHSTWISSFFFKYQNTRRVKYLSVDGLIWYHVLQYFTNAMQSPVHCSRPNWNNDNGSSYILYQIILRSHIKCSATYVQCSIALKYIGLYGRSKS